MSTEGVYRATSRNLLKEIRRENFEKCLVDYKRLMLFIGDEKSLVEKGALCSLRLRRASSVTNSDPFSNTFLKSIPTNFF